MYKPRAPSINAGGRYHFFIVAEVSEARSVDFFFFRKSKNEGVRSFSRRSFFQSLEEAKYLGFSRA